MHVHHGERVEDARRDEAAVGHDDAELGADRRDVVEAVGHLEAEIERRALDRAGRAPRPRAPAACRPGSPPAPPRARRPRAPRARPRRPAASRGRPGGPPAAARRYRPGCRSAAARRRRAPLRPSGSASGRPRARVRRIRLASLRWSSSSRSTSSTPSRWSTSCWNTRAEELVGVDGDLVAVEVEPGEVDLLGAHDGPRQTRDRQAPLVVGPLPPSLGEHGVHDRHRPRPVAGVVDEHPLLDAHLGGRQAHTGRLVHRLHHVVGQLLERPVDVLDLRGPLPQHGVAVEPDRVPRHAGHGTGGGHRPPALCSVAPGAAQDRTGSTSTRSRPGGRATPASRSHSVAWSGARTDHTPSTGPLTSTLTGDGLAQGGAVGVGRGPDTTAMALKGGGRRARRTSASASASTPGSADTAASEGGVAGLAGLDDHAPRARGPVAGRAGPP